MTADEMVAKYLRLRVIAEKIVSDNYKQSWKTRDVIGVTQTLMLIEAIGETRTAVQIGESHVVQG